MEHLAALHEPDPTQNLSPALAEWIYGNVLRTSVSRLEEFAQCPFKFFIRSGLHAGERKIFELDARERGTFQHDVLKIFHEQLVAEKKRWRDLTPQAAREQIGQIAAVLAADFRGGLLRDTPQTKFAARAMTESLQNFVEVIVSWMRNQYEFDPAAVELSFGEPDSPAPAWEVDLGSGRKLALRGRIDRVDVSRASDGQSALAVVLDYKSSGKKLEAVFLENGVQLQLAAYLNALRNFTNTKELFGVEKLLPTGVFYINLRGQFENGETRSEVLGKLEESRRAAYRHTGRFDAGALGKLDSKGTADQFNYKINKDGTLYKGSSEALSRDEFEALLDGVEAQLCRIGSEIFAGTARVDPYRKGKETPCEYCDYAAACRIDPWTHRYRVLAKAVSTE
jgi:ATP-dependent helicase/nuclease subunit B